MLNCKMPIFTRQSSKSSRKEYLKEIALLKNGSRSKGSLNELKAKAKDKKRKPRRMPFWEKLMRRRDMKHVPAVTRGMTSTCEAWLQSFRLNRESYHPTYVIPEEDNIINESLTKTSHHNADTRHRDRSPHSSNPGPDITPNPKLQLNQKIPLRNEITGLYNTPRTTMVTRGMIARYEHWLQSTRFNSKDSPPTNVNIGEHSNITASHHRSISKTSMFPPPPSEPLLEPHSKMSPAASVNIQKLPSLTETHPNGDTKGSRSPLLLESARRPIRTRGLKRQLERQVLEQNNVEPVFNDTRDSILAGSEKDLPLKENERERKDEKQFSSLQKNSVACQVSDTIEKKNVACGPESNFKVDAFTQVNPMEFLMCMGEDKVKYCLDPDYNYLIKQMEGSSQQVVPGDQRVLLRPPFSPEIAKSALAPNAAEIGFCRKRRHICKSTGFKVRYVDDNGDTLREEAHWRANIIPNAETSTQVDLTSVFNLPNDVVKSLMSFRRHLRENYGRAAVREYKPFG